MKYIIDISERHKYAVEMGMTQNGSIASKVILNAVKDGVPYEEIPRKELIKDIQDMICKVNDYYGYTDSMHMFKVLFDQKYHGWVKLKEGEKNV